MVRALSLLCAGSSARFGTFARLCVAPGLFIRTNRSRSVYRPVDQLQVSPRMARQNSTVHVRVHRRCFFGVPLSDFRPKMRLFWDVPGVRAAFVAEFPEAMR